MYFNKDYRIIKLNEDKYLATNIKSGSRNQMVYKIDADIINSILASKFDLNDSRVKQLIKNEVLTSTYSDHQNICHDCQEITSVSFEIEGRCNLNCLHCYQSDKLQRKLKIEQVFNLVDKIADAGCIFLQLTGGEPMLRDDFLEIYKYASKKGMQIKISSNGTLLTDEIISEFQKNPPYFLSISFYGTGKMADRLTRQDDYFKNFSSKIIKLHEAKVNFDLKLILLKTNQSEFPMMIDFAKKYSLQYYSYHKLINRLNNNTTSHLISDQDYIKIARNSNLMMTDRVEKSIRKKGCNAGKKSFVIDSVGNVYICKLFRQKSIDILKYSFKEIKDYFQKILPGIFSKPTKCITCNKWDECTSCPIVIKSFLNTTDNCFCV